MRVLVLALLLANILFFGWQYWLGKQVTITARQDQSGRVTADPGQFVNPPLGQCGQRVDAARSNCAGSTAGEKASVIPSTQARMQIDIAGIASQAGLHHTCPRDKNAPEMTAIAPNRIQRAGSSGIHYAYRACDAGECSKHGKPAIHTQ